jgi:hypothetical protein
VKIKSARDSIFRLYRRGKGIFAHSAEGTDPIGGNSIEGGSGLYAAAGIADLGIVYITAHITNIFFHFGSLPLIEKYNKESGLFASAP